MLSKSIENSTREISMKIDIRRIFRWVLFVETIGAIHIMVVWAERRVPIISAVGCAMAVCCLYFWYKFQD